MPSEREDDSPLREQTVPRDWWEAVSPADRGSVESGEGSRTLPKDTVFELLTSSRRRAVITYLYTVGREAKRDELAEQLTAAEQSIHPSEVTEKQRKRVSIDLYHCHLPRMADAGVIEYDPNRGRVQLTERSTQLIPYIELDHTDRETTEPLSW